MIFFNFCANIIYSIDFLYLIFIISQLKFEKEVLNNNRSYNHLRFEEDLLKKELPIDEHDYLIIEYLDSFNPNGNKKVQVKNLGEKFAAINSFFFDYLKEYHIPAAFVKMHNKTTLKFVKHTRFPFYVKIINIIDKRTAKIFSKKESEILNLPIFEIHFGEGKDSLITESHLISFDLCTNEDIKVISRICSKVNAVLKSFFERRGYLLAEASCSFGKFEEKIFLVDDFTPRSVKVIPLNKNSNGIDPYKFNTSAEIRHYTDQLFNMMSA